MTILEKSSTSRRRSGHTVLILLSLLAVMSGLAGMAQADDFLTPLIVDKVQTTSDDSKTRSEGLLLESPPTYIEFNGSNGLQLKISLPRSRMFDYTLMFWFRSTRSYPELA